MEDQNNTQKNNNLMPIAVLAIVAIVAIGVYLTQQKTEDTTNTTQTSTSTELAETEASYNDGTYIADGSYVSPGGPRDIGVSVTLENGIITDTSIEVRASDATSKRLQQEFADNYKQVVVGKNINEVNLSKVSGSSLTPKGFNDALTKIKAEAKS